MQLRETVELQILHIAVELLLLSNLSYFHTADIYQQFCQSNVA